MEKSRVTVHWSTLSEWNKIENLRNKLNIFIFILVFYYYISFHLLNQGETKLIMGLKI